MIKMKCGCIWSEIRKCCVHRCRIHLDQQIKNNITTQNQINAEMLQREMVTAKENASNNSTGLHLNPYIFGKKKKYYLKKLF